MGFLKLSTPLILAASLLSSLAQAAPAFRAIKARDYFTEVVTETVWETVDITTTVYVDDLPSTAAPASTTAEVTSAEEVVPTTVSTSTPAATSTSAYVAPASEPASSTPSSSGEDSVAPASAGEFAESSASPPSSTSPALAASTPSPAAVAAPPPPPANQIVDSSASSGGSESATCEGGSSSCKGDVTHWDGGLGACGTVVDTEGEMAIALPFGFMGTASNSNPYCGRSLTIKTVSGSTVQATVKDKCMGCVGRSIDLTNKLFNAVTDGKGDGRVKNVEWWFNG